MLRQRLIEKLSRRFGIVFFMPLGLIILSCGFLYPAKDACAFESGDALVVGSISDARVLVPILASDSGSGEIVSMLFNGLVKYDKDLSLTGDLAETWEVQDDCRVIIFHLRHNVRWHDGEPFTAADVEFTYNKLIDPGVRTPYSGDFERVKSFKVIDDYTIKVTYKEPFAPGISSWGMPIMPRHLLENEDLNNTEFNLHPVGTGPYKFKSWRRQEKIELIANPDYFEHKPYIERYIFRVIPDQATLFLELQAQGLDYTWLSPLQYQRQTNSDFFKKHFRKFSVTGRSYIYLGYNLNNSKFKDKRVRRALNYAVDKNEIIDIALLGIGQVCTGPFLPESWAFNPEVKAVPFDPLAARELLAAAGWVDTNQDGWLDKNGEDFEFTIITNLGNEERRKTAEIIQRRLAGIGIRVEIRILEWTVFLSEFIDKRNFDVILLGWGLGLDPDNYDIWHSSKTREGEFNFIGYSNEEVDRLLEKARRTCQQAEREVYYKRIHEIIYEEQPYMFLYISNSLAIVHSRFRNVSLEPIGIRYNLIDWWVPKEEQRYQIKY